MRRNFQNNRNALHEPDKGDVPVVESGDRHPPKPLTDAENRAVRVEQLLRQGSAQREIERKFAEDRRQHLMIQAAKDALKDSEYQNATYMTFVSEETDGSLSFEHIIFRKAPPELIALVEPKAKHELLTWLSWEALDLPARMTLISTKRMQPDAVSATGLHEVLATRTLDYILEWQKHVNSGHAFQYSDSIGRHVNHHIEEGYLLRAPETVTWPGGELESRAQFEGRPGSASYVKAINGAGYLDWLLAHEQKPIDV